MWTRPVGIYSCKSFIIYSYIYIFVADIKFHPQIISNEKVLTVRSCVPVTRTAARWSRSGPTASSRTPCSPPRSRRPSRPSPCRPTTALRWPSSRPERQSHPGLPRNPVPPRRRTPARNAVHSICSRVVSFGVFSGFWTWRDCFLYAFSFLISCCVGEFATVHLI